VKYLKGNLTIILVLVLVIIFTVALLIVIKNSKEQKALTESEAGSALAVGESEAKYTDISGNEIALTDYLGQVLIVNSWASWSPFSANELSELSKVAGEYSSSNIKILAINRAEAGTTAERYLNTISANENILLVLDPSDYFYKSISGYAMPETVFYDAKGNTVHHNHGPMSAEEIRLNLNRALNTSL
jgi:thiol-disulfide isomerase/thioredoxin